jgi:hypothetical protein
LHCLCDVLIYILTFWYAAFETYATDACGATVINTFANDHALSSLSYKYEIHASNLLSGLYGA